MSHFMVSLVRVGWLDVTSVRPLSAWWLKVMRIGVLPAGKDGWPSANRKTGIAKRFDLVFLS